MPYDEWEAFHELFPAESVSRDQLATAGGEGPARGPAAAPAEVIAAVSSACSSAVARPGRRRGASCRRPRG